MVPKYFLILILVSTKTYKMRSSLTFSSKLRVSVEPLRNAIYATRAALMRCGSVYIAGNWEYFCERARAENLITSALIAVTKE
jgi:hypothetical protein